MKGIKLKVWKEGKRFLSMALCAAMIGGMLGGAAVPAQAAVSQVDGKDVYEYTFAELEKSVNPAEASDVTYTDDKETGVTTASYSDADYKSLNVDIPEEVRVAGLEKVEVILADSNEGAVADLALKVLPSTNDQMTVSYESLVKGGLEAYADRASFNQIAIMTLDKKLNRTYKFAKVRFTCGEETVPDESDEKIQTYEFSKLERTILGNLSYEDNEDGSTDITYDGEYQSLLVKIPSDVKAADLDKVVVNLKAGESSNLALKAFTQDQATNDKYGNGVVAQYGTTTLSVAGVGNKADITHIVVMSAGGFSGKVTVESVSFYCKEAKAEPEAYAASGLEYKMDDQVSATVSENGALLVDFSGNYKTIYFKIPRTVNVNTLVGIDFGVDSISSNTVSANNVAAKVFVEGEDGSLKEKAVNYSAGTITDFSWVDATNKPAYVGIMSCYSEDLPQDTEISAVISGITFTFFKDGTENRFIEEDIPSLYEAVSSDFSMGVAIPAGALKEEERMKLVYKHFNSVTCENEMKPDSILGSEPKVSDIKEVELNFDAADAIMDAIVSANDAGKANIKVRGHVLVWHSQTPTWFFREGLKSNGKYVDAAEMNERLEWYIKSVVEHFDTKYKGLIYAWDVVNEQANDAGGLRTMHNDGTLTDWYSVYGDNEYILKAFEYADKYTAKNTILFYNDYNECTPTKCETIVGFLEEIREVIDDERKLGAGMQGHHDMASPTIDVIKDAAMAYAAVADEVHITELDIKSTMGYVDSEKARAREFTKQAHRYKDIYDMVKEVNAETDGKIKNITIWGTDDKNSWLTSSNNVGGSADGKTPQFPLLFDKDLKAKPSYWAFVNQEKLEPSIQELIAMSTDNFDYATAYDFKADDTTVTMKPIWSAGKVQLQISLSKALGETDTVTVYLDPKATAAEGNFKVDELAAEDFNNNTAVVDIEVEDLDVSQTVSFDVVVNKGGVAYSFNDKKNTQNTTSKFYAELTTKPLMEVKAGTACVDGDVSDWENIPAVELNVVVNDTSTTEGPAAEATSKVCWDEENLYVLTVVKDDNLDAKYTDSGNAYKNDSVEIFIDELNEKSGSYDNNDKQYRISYLNDQSFNGKTCTADNIVSMTSVSENTYVVETAIKWTELKPVEGKLIGLELQINDAKDGNRLGTKSWFDATGKGYENPSVLGTAILVEANEAPEDADEAVEAVEEKINAIGDVAYTEKSKSLIDAAKEAYAELLVEVRLLVEKAVAKKLFAAEDAYAALEKQVEDVIAMIEAIGDVTYSEESLNAITEAKAAYDALNADQKAAMKDVAEKLTAAEKAYETAKAEYLANEENKKNDAAAVKNVTDKINAIGTVTYDEAVKAKIDEARAAYDALTQAQKDQISADVLKVLTDAETAYKAAEEAAKEAEKKEEIKYFAKFSVKSIPLKVGQSSDALAKDIQIAKGDKVVKWTTSNKKIVTVNAKSGKIKGKKAGKATITAYTESGLTATIKVVVQKKKVAPIKVSLTDKATNKAIKANSTVTLKKGKQMTVVATVKPMTCKEKVTFKTSNKKIVTVTNKGVIKAKKKGTATITAKVGKKTFKFKVKVK